MSNILFGIQLIKTNNHRNWNTFTRFIFMFGIQYLITTVFAFDFYKTRTRRHLLVRSLQEDACHLELDLKARIQNEIKPTKRGIARIDESKKQQINHLIQELEDQCPLKEPARSPLMDGRWIVQYSTAPPPSNGQLGPFIGIARQYIDLKSKSYINHLSVPGDLKDEWLSAILSATFQEWDGVAITDTPITDLKASPFLQYSSSSMQDYGASSWKVTFKKLSIRILGVILFEKEFKTETSRVWKMTYLDNDTRVVRAGKTGLKEDDVLFFMTRI